jgi:lipopolysaccharide/colanic/teichoic acid biosynthesis glycosyltransferase
MKDSKDEKGILLPDKSRLNRFGKYLRSYSLDELPELFNILKGDMAVVGPRPLLIKDIVFMTHKQLQRYSIKPGLTGLAQINGRNDILWEKKLYLDLVYVNNITIKNDLRIILKTIVKSFKQEGINTKGMATAEDLGDYLLRIKKINYREYYSGIEKFQIISNSLLKSKTIN